jgi:hypothetical protein
VAVVLQYTKTQNNTYTHSKQCTTHKITNTINKITNNAHKITNIIFQPNKEPKVEYNTIIQKTHTHTKGYNGYLGVGGVICASLRTDSI